MSAGLLSLDGGAGAPVSVSCTRVAGGGTGSEAAARLATVAPFGILLDDDAAAFSFDFEATKTAHCVNDVTRYVTVVDTLATRAYFRWLAHSKRHDA